MRWFAWIRESWTPQSGWMGRWLGNAGERLAARHLRGLGYRILHRQYRSAWGEMDLIARDGDCIVFVEVKTRRSSSAGNPVEAVHQQKQTQLTRLALAYLKQRGLLDHRARFDVVSIVWPSERRQPPQIAHFRNAFEPAGEGQMFG